MKNREGSEEIYALTFSFLLWLCTNYRSEGMLTSCLSPPFRQIVCLSLYKGDMQAMG